MNNHYTSTLHFLALIITLFLAACGGSGGGGGGSVTYTIGGTVAGLTGTLVLQNNAGDNLSVTGSSFTFATTVASGSDYNVTILTQPEKQRCFVGTGVGAGTATANVSNITIACASQKGGAMQGIPLNLAPTVSTLAGTANPAADGIGAAARFLGSSAVVSDGVNLYVVDQGSKIRKIVIASGTVSTLAGSGVFGGADGIGVTATFNSPKGITIDSTGSNLYVADTGNHKIRQIVIASGAVSTLAGSGGAGAADGTGTAATFNTPYGITIDSTNTNLYVTDKGNNKIRKIVLATAVVSSFTGTANTGGTIGAADGSAATATFNGPVGITTDGSNLYVSEYENQKIRKIVLATATVSSLTGTANTASNNGSQDGAAATVTFAYPEGITTDGSNLYVADEGNNKIRVVALSNGTTSSLTGVANTTGTQGYADGAGAAATFRIPYNVTTTSGQLYVVDRGNRTIRSITISSAAVSTLAGNANPAADGAGAAARFNQPQQVTSDGVNLYVADSLNHIIRKIVIASGAVSTLAGTGASGVADGTGSTAWFNTPRGITTDGSNVYVADTGNNKIRQIAIATGLVTTLAGGSGASGAADGTGTAAAFNSPQDITTDGANLYVADTGNNKIRKIVIASGAVSSLTGAANMAGAAGSADGAGTAATFNWPQGITTDGANLYVADTLNYKIRKIVLASGAVSSLTGAANAAAGQGFADGSGTTATFADPVGITTDGSNLYVVDFGNRKIRKIDIATAVVSSLTGTANTTGAAGFADGTGAAATFNGPYGITSDGASLYVTELVNGVIRKIQ